jgi:hypothetical protein
MDIQLLICNMLMIPLFFLKLIGLWLRKLNGYFILFKVFLGYKLIFAKTKLISLNISSTDANFYYNILQCKLDKLPIKYMGVWLPWKKINKEA